MMFRHKISKMYRHKISDKYETLVELLSKLLTNPYTSKLITNPIITKEGKLGSGRDILSSLQKEGELFNEDDLLPDLTLSQILDTITASKNFYHLQLRLRMNLCCPLSHALFQDPVIASDGCTYERSHIERYLEENGAPPKEIFWTQDIFHLVEHGLIKIIIKTIEEYNRYYTADKLDLMFNQHTAALLDYASKQQHVPSSLIGSNFSKGEKIDAATKLVSALTQPLPFAAIDERTLEIALNSDLQHIAIPALGFLIANEHKLPGYIEAANQGLASKEPIEKEAPTFGRH